MPLKIKRKRGKKTKNLRKIKPTKRKKISSKKMKGGKKQTFDDEKIMLKIKSEGDFSKVFELGQKIMNNSKLKAHFLSEAEKLKDKINNGNITKFIQLIQKINQMLENNPYKINDILNHCKMKHIESTMSNNSTMSRKPMMRGGGELLTLSFLLFSCFAILAICTFIAGRGGELDEKDDDILFDLLDFLNM